MSLCSSTPTQNHVVAQYRHAMVVLKLRLRPLVFLSQLGIALAPSVQRSVSVFKVVVAVRTHECAHHTGHGRMADSSAL